MRQVFFRSALSGMMALFAASAMAGAVQPQAPMPVAPAPQAQTQPRPAQGPTPQVRPCKEKDLLGIWRLMAVKEVPVGAATNSLKADPEQYVRFNSNTTYNEIKGNRVLLKKADIETVFKQTASARPQQFVLTEESMLYFYRERIAVDSLFCAVVSADMGSFKVGDLLLHTSSNPAYKLIKTYRKPTFN